MKILAQKPNDWYWVYFHNCDHNNAVPTLVVQKIEAWAKDDHGQTVGILNINNQLVIAPSPLGSEYKHLRDLTTEEIYIIKNENTLCGCVSKRPLKAMPPLHAF